MWAISNTTPFAADRAFARDKSGAEIWVVAVRGTFDILPDGRLEIASGQSPVAVAPEWTGEPGKSSLRWDMDLVRCKPGTDVIINGEAHAPAGCAVRQLEVSLSIGPISKRLRVSGDREYRDGLLTRTLTEPKPYKTIPITYERAYGGQVLDDETKALKKQVDANPIGCGLRPKSGERHPNVEYPPGRFGSTAKPAGFGAIPASWQPRVGLAGTYDDRWQETRAPLLAEDFQDDYFYSAPPDQRVPGYLRGGEPVELINLSADGPMRFSLPRVRLGLTTHIAGDRVQHKADLHTVIVEPTAMRLIMVWQSALPCHHTLYSLERTKVFQKEWLSDPEPQSAASPTKGAQR